MSKLQQVYRRVAGGRDGAPIGQLAVMCDVTPVDRFDVSPSPLPSVLQIIPLVEGKVFTVESGAAAAFEAVPGLGYDDDSGVLVDETLDSRHLADTTLRIGSRQLFAIVTHEQRTGQPVGVPAGTPLEQAVKLLVDEFGHAAVVHRVVADLDSIDRADVIMQVDGMFRAEQAAMASLTRFERGRAYRNKIGGGCVIVQGEFMPYDADMPALVGQTLEGAIVDMRSKNPADWELIDDGTWYDAWTHPTSADMRNRGDLVDAKIEDRAVDLAGDGIVDAQIWAQEFMRVVDQENRVVLDEGLMIGWFANAIETAKRVAVEQRPEPTTARQWS